MTTYALIQNGIVAQLLPLPDGVTLDECVPADMIPSFVELPDGSPVQANWTYDGTNFAAPVVAPPPTVIRTASGANLIKASDDADWVKVKARDQGRIAGRALLPETSPVVARAATVMSTTPKAWFDTALGAA